VSLDHHSHHIEDPNATTPPPQVELVGSVPSPPVPSPSEAMTIRVTLPPGSAGSPPHRHTGPAFGYDAQSRFVVTMFGVPGQPALIPVSAEELEERRSRRAPPSVTWSMLSS
jgi:hypothetical protein